MIARRIIAHGRVQGVFFRNWTVKVARSLGVRGWVRNRRDGSVEILSIGADEAVAALIEQCRAGPPGARVEKLDISETTPELLETFDKRGTV